MDERINVLYVDDNPRSLSVSGQQLAEDERIELETATTATEGKKLLDKTEYDCVVSDIQMPEQDGFDFLETIRESHPNVPFIFYSSIQSEEMIKKVLNSEATDFVPKSIGTVSHHLLSRRIVIAVEHCQTKQYIKELESLQ
ncbi:response regulator [Halorubrum vacuolatum]|uniref:CheY chemotaxis protein or a CheY-like REC (Receiver) domain n=1 Tax=Halorubrum vacuolatum TaxID=63740 RepID=A0A238YIE1_HALVU|nr:response regulator [Halorubrum vacuolatum]SNR70840.1 CheY chemotaxis protein or a CheY-like REC (receiver) domain [Halorubrum vacuolatum]